MWTSNKDGISILRFLPFEKLGLLLQDVVALTCDPVLIIRFLLCFETKSSSPPLFFCPHVFPVVPFQVLLSFPLFLQRSYLPDAGLFFQMNDLILVSQQLWEFGVVMLQMKKGGLQQIQ